MPIRRLQQIFRPLAILMVSLVFALRTSAQERAERPQVTAAMAEAVANMRAQIEDAPLNHKMSVGEFLHRLGAEKELDDGLMRAELVGGPRWVDADTCQVQLQMSGVRVGRILQHIAADHPDQSPISSGEISHLTAEWDRRTFSGTGSSTAFAHVHNIRPQAIGSVWDGVSDADRKKALSSAEDDAIKHVLDSVQPILFADGKTVGDVMDSHPKVRQALLDWLNIRPVLRVEYRRDLQIELTMAGTPDGVFDTFRRAASDEPDVKVPRHEIGWSAIRNDFEKQMALPIGHATVAPTTAPAIIEPLPALQLPRRAPAWVADHIELDATAEASPDSQLRAARLAEAAARRKILDKINELPLSRRVTVGQAAQQDPRIRNAVAQAVGQAQIIKTDYSHKKIVTITLRLDLQDLWDALRSSQ
jgi:hypothetical protein